MDILYVCNEKVQRSFMSQAIFHKIRNISNSDPCVRSTSIFSKKFYELKNNLFSLLDNIRKMREAKWYV